MPTAGRLHDRLVQAFGRKKIFMDVDHIPAGVDFVTYLDQQVARCDVFLALIGPRWLDAQDDTGARRLENADDFVAIEIAAALQRSIRVIPVLIDGARMPKGTELPETLRSLARRNAVEVRNPQFGRDAETLVQKVGEAVKGDQAPRGRWGLGLATAAAALLLAAGAAYYVAHSTSPEWWDTAGIWTRAEKKLDDTVVTAKAAPEQSNAAASSGAASTPPRSPAPEWWETAAAALKAKSEPEGDKAAASAVVASIEPQQRPRLTGFDAEVAAVRDMGFFVLRDQQFHCYAYWCPIGPTVTTADSFSQCASGCRSSDSCEAFDYDTATRRCQSYQRSPWPHRKRGDGMALGFKQQVAGTPPLVDAKVAGPGFPSGTSVQVAAAAPRQDEAKPQHSDENLSPAELHDRYGEIQQESEWLIVSGKTAIDSGYNSEPIRGRSGRASPRRSASLGASWSGQGSSLTECKSLCSSDGRCRAFSWSVGRCHLFQTQVIETVTSNAGTMGFKQ